MTLAIPTTTLCRLQGPPFVFGAACVADTTPRWNQVARPPLLAARHATTAHHHCTHRHHRTHRVAASSSSFGAATTARTTVRPRATRAHRRSGWRSSSEFACGPSGGRRELVRMWPPEFWKELAWWPTGARSDVAAGDLVELVWWPPLDGDLAELASSSSAASPSL